MVIGRKGKTVTVIRGLGLEAGELSELAGELMKRLTAEMQQGGPVGAVETCFEVAQEIAELPALPALGSGSMQPAVR